MRSEFEEWYRDKYQVTKQLYFFEDTQRYEDGFAQDAWEVWQHQQSKVDELQKRVDASLIAFEKLKEEINELHGQCDLHLIKYLEEKAQVLEQALKGGNHEAN